MGEQENGFLVMTDPTDQVDKVIQLYETMLTRHTTMVVGPTGGGKSVILHTLARAQTKMDYPTKLFVINPKAQPTSELYGLMGVYLQTICICNFHHDSTGGNTA